MIPQQTILIHNLGQRNTIKHNLVVIMSKSISTTHETSYQASIIIIFF